MNFFNKFNKLKNKYKDNNISVISLFVCIFGLFALTAGSSYAYLTYSKVGTEVNKISAGTLVLNFKNESSAIYMTNAVPQTDSSGLKNTQTYSFTLNNTGSLNAKYEIRLKNVCVADKTFTEESNTVTPDRCIPLDYIKAGVKIDSGNYSVVEASDGKIVLDSSTIKAGTSGRTYTIKLWLDESTPNNYQSIDQDGKNRVVAFIGQVEIYGEQIATDNTDIDDNPVVQEKYDIADKTNLVGILYSTWHDYMNSKNNGVYYNNTEIQASGGSYGPVGAYHYWAEPALGYYSDTDKTVLRTHMTQLADAGVDFIILDHTNVTSSWIGDGVLETSSAYYKHVTAPVKALMETITEMRSEGLKTPYVVNWQKTDDDGVSMVRVFNNLFVNDYDKEALASDGFDKENWQYNYVYWDGKPFVLTTTTLDSGDVTNANITYRKMWAFQGSSKINSWSYLEQNNTIGGLNPSGSGYEQMSASVAMQKTHMSNTSTATGRNGGKTWYNQWVNVFKNHPKVVTITWWNEWGGERQANGTNYCPTTGACFTDNYNQEYSRDIEPMKGGHGDKYYKWLKQYITAYKANSAVPQLYD